MPCASAAGEVVASGPTYLYPAAAMDLQFAPDSRMSAPHMDAWLGSLIEQQRDPSGLVYRRNRYYDPATGRFTQEDPIGLAGGMNLYGYGDGDPLNNADPFGLCTDKAGKTVLCPDKEKMAQWMQDNAGSKSTGQCAKVCRQGLEAGGMDMGVRPDSAFKYGAFLLERGAGIVPAGKEPEVGDIMVYDANAAHPVGHVQIFTREGWISDWKQSGVNPYRNKASAGNSTLYRFPGMAPAIVITPESP